MKASYLLIVSIFVALISKADVIIGDAQLNPGTSSSLMLVTTNSNPAGGLSVIIDDLGGGSYEFTDGILSFYGLYAAAPGLDFTPSYANSNSILVPGTSIQTFTLNETKYFAYWEDDMMSTGTPVVEDNYGWVSLTHTVSGLSISNSATAIGGGIIVGTYTQIPEPSSVLLLMFGSGSILFYRRAKCRQQGQHISRRTFE